MVILLVPKKWRSQAIGCSEGGLGIKIHATLDALCNPISFHLVSRNAHNLRDADGLIPNLEEDILLAEKA